MTRVSFFNSFSSSNSLAEGSFSFSRSQLQTDSAFHGISEELGHWQSLTAMTIDHKTFTLFWAQMAAIFAS